MTENSIYRNISQHDASRTRRLTCDRGHFTDCRHYSKTGERTFYCKKINKAKRSCEGCFTCPNCGGLMYTAKIKKERNRNVLYITHAKTCHICGAYIEEHLVCHAEQKEKKNNNSCQVQGCHSTVYSDHTHSEEGKTFRICEKHRNRMKSWRQHPSKGEDQKPILLQNGMLVDNPRYTIKQGKRK